jgi:hypothetical protein
LYAVLTTIRVKRVAASGANEGARPSRYGHAVAGARKPKRGGRYTPPKPRLPAVDVEDEVDVVAGLANSDRALRARCAALLLVPPTDEEWREADLLSSDALDATDEELVAYWSTHRRIVELELDVPGFPDLTQICEALARGVDPAQEVVAFWTADHDDP